MENEPVNTSVGESSPQAFAPQSPKSSANGCSRVGLVGCGVLTLLMGLAAVVFLLKAEDLFGWAMESFQTQVLQSLPADLEDDDAKRLSTAFDSAILAVKAGKVDPRALQRMQEELRQSLWESGDTLSPDQILRLTESLEDVAAIDSGESDVDRDLE